MLPLPILLVALAACALVASYVYFGRRAAVQGELDWQTLVGRLQPLPGPGPSPGLGLTAVAEAYLHPRLNQIELQPQDIFDLLGGLDGMRVMHQNARVMLELAGYATRWNQVEGVIVTEMIRRDVRRLHRALRLIRLEMYWPRFAVHTPFRMQEAAAAYHLMSSRLVTLYESSHMGLYPRLAASL